MLLQYGATHFMGNGTTRFDHTCQSRKRQFICGQALVEGLVEQQGPVEILLSLGGDRWEAGRSPLQEAVRTGMIPIINSMIETLPRIRN